MTQSASIDFHDLYDLIGEKCDEIRAGAAGRDLDAQEVEAINSLERMQVEVFRICTQDPCDSYVFRC